VADHWSAAPIATAQSWLAGAKDAMRAAMLKPVGHGPPVRPQIVDAIANPQALPPDARAALMSKLYAKYGEQAANVAPYIDGQGM
jgi:hypothetical protein